MWPAAQRKDTNVRCEGLWQSGSQLRLEQMYGCCGHLEPVIVMAFQLNQNVLCLERILGAADVCQSGAGSWADEEAVLLRTQL